jgi:hypothetical protein
MEGGIMRYLSIFTLASCVAISSLSTTIHAQTKAKAKAPAQTVNPAPVNYWMDVSTGATGSGGGMMGSLMGGMMARGRAGGESSSGNSFGNLFGGNTNWFGAANSGATGQRTDIALFDRRQPGAVNATQVIPQGLRLGASLPLLPPPPPSPTTRTPFDERDPTPPEMPDQRVKMTIKAYWGCSPTVREGQPRIQTFEMGGPQGMAMYGSTVQGRYERDRGATSNNKSSIWPNRTSSNAIQNGASLVGDHKITGAGLPDSLGFALTQSQDFMPDLGLRAAGNKSGVLTLNWTNLPTANAYFAAASGMIFQGGNDGGGEDVTEMTMITWSASDKPESGMGLINYISNANQERYLADKVILPAGTTSCQIPSGIFAGTMMVNFNAIAYGRELNLVYPARPTDPRIPWNQEWTARVRVKSVSNVTMMGDMMGAANTQDRRSNPTGAAAEPNPNLPKCKPAEQTARGAAGRAILGAATRGILGGLSAPRPQRPGVDCNP